ncbi:Spermidine synthase [Thalassoporum mexicanum PCC 7367]|uniref:polyamine aminopropyltransferase n=1 Tax=Thalassoporum mexicanum TaxID=3457544 RepID=UPI00029FBFCF|nr:polyamine aminopropyltransferase [Pseudanabaena sp. PCC 7367]AFY71339.1 Spermidine synthase [Pseudanabaena sp. PCC 7367]
MQVSRPEVGQPETIKPKVKIFDRKQKYVLLAAAAVSSTCGLATELLLGTLSSYLVGNQALSYGVSVGVFLAAMGIGAYFSGFIVDDQGQNSLDLSSEPAILNKSESESIDSPPNNEPSATSLTNNQNNQSLESLDHAESLAKKSRSQLLNAFVLIELTLAPLCALLPLALFALFVVDGPVWLGLVLVALLLGTLAGLEVPLITRLLEQDEGVKDSLSKVLALDYLGALVGSLLFPVVLLPWMGLFPAAAVIGVLPALIVAAVGLFFPGLRNWGKVGLAVAIALCIFAPFTVILGDRLENSMYDAAIAARVQSPYQRIVLTRKSQDVRLFLDGDLQFSSVDEYRYHEALVHPAMSASGNPQNVLLLGAGDGMALREILKWPDVERVVLIELDQAVVNLAQRHPFLTRLNHDSFADSRVEVIFADAFVTVPQLEQKFDVIIADFPDPDQEILAKLYSSGFYRRILPKLAANGVFVTQASSPFFAPKVMSCIATTLESVGLAAKPYTIDVPSFGPWGFVIASRNEIKPQGLKLAIASNLKFLTEPMLPSLFNLPGDVRSAAVEVNKLSRPVIVNYEADARWVSY